MFHCPNCQGEIERERHEDGLHWVCRSCSGRTVNLSVLRKTRSAAFVAELWAKVRNGDGVFDRACPACTKPMLTVSVASGAGWEELDACKVCQFVWFDPEEFQRIPIAVPVKPKDEPRELPQKAKEALALYEVQRLGEQVGPEPASEWKTIPAALGLPVERDDDGHDKPAWATWGLCAVVLLVSVMAFTDLYAAVNTFGLVPDQFWRYGGLTSFTSFFLHGSWVHLLGNLYFLFVFGDNVEHRIGRRRMLMLVFCATFAGDLMHVLGDARSSVPCIGASGGISGVLAFYALAFPDKKLSILWTSRYTKPWWIEMSAWTAFGLWIAMQMLIVMQQLAGLGRVSALAHLGGVMAGAVLWLLWKNSLPKKECPIRRLTTDGHG